MNAQIQFANAWVLYLLWLVPLLAWAWLAAGRRQEKNLGRFVSAEMQRKLRPRASRARFLWQSWLLAAGLFLVLLAAARPQWGMKEQVVYQRGRNLVIALDVSRSMLANDVHPNRLQRAKADIMDLIKELKGDKAALLAFRRRAILLCPLTTDYAYLRQSLEAVDIDSAPSGETDIGEAIRKAMDAFQGDEGDHNAIILISDGEDLTGKAMAAAQTAAKRNIPVFTVGLGNRQGSKIPVKDKSSLYLQYKGDDVVTRLSDETLRQIADTTRGAYIPVETASMTTITLGTLYRDYLSKITAQELEETLQRRYVERYQLFLVPAFLLLLAAAFLSRGRLAISVRAPAPGPAAVPPPARPGRSTPLATPATTILLISLAALPVHAQSVSNSLPPSATAAGAPQAAETNRIVADPSVPSGREGARIAQNHYGLGRYEKAAAAYLGAARGASDQSQRDFTFNAAVSLYKAGRFQEAADLLRDLSRVEKTSESDVAMALGASLFRAAGPERPDDPPRTVARPRGLREAGEAFKDAARAQPDNAAARHNLAVALDVLPKAEEQGRVADLMLRYGTLPPQAIADMMLVNQRKLLGEIPSAFTNDSPEQIKALESLAERQKSNADLLVPLKGLLLNAIAAQKSNDPKAQQQVAAFEQAVEITRDKMKNASDSLRDLDPSGYRTAAESEAGVYTLWKSVADYHGLLREDILRQTNAIILAASPRREAMDVLKAEQEEATSLTDLFVKRFSEAIPEGGEPEPPAATNQSGSAATAGPAQDQRITAELRKKILDLAADAADSQKLAGGMIATNRIAAALSEQRDAYERLKEIEKLLPKKQAQQQEKEQKQDQQDKQDQQQKQDQQDKKEQPQSQPEQQQKPEQAKPEDKDKPDKKDEMSAEKLQQLLEKAAQREKEHEMEKRSRNRSIPLSPIDRDW